MTYNTTSKRIYGSAQILDDIDNYESQWTNFLKTEGISMSQFVVGDTSASDGYNRQITVGCLDTIIGNCEEASYLDGYTYKTNKWTDLTTIMLTGFVPYYTDVIDASGNKYPNTITDLAVIWNMAKPYSENRNDYFQNKGVYDDDYLRVRTITETKKIYTNVLNDVDVYKDDWGGVGVDKYYKAVMENIETKEWETSDLPIDMPTTKDLKGLVYRNGSADNFLGQVSQAESLLNSINGKLINYSWFSYFKFKRIELDGYNRISFTITGNKNYIDNIEKNCPINLFFEDAGHTGFAVATVISKSTGKTNEEIKSVFESRYAAATSEIKSDIYDDAELYEYYYSYDYYITVQCEVNYIDINDYNTELLLQPTIGANSIVNYTKNLLNILANYLNKAYDKFNSLSDSAKEYELDPVNNYPKYINLLESLKNTTNNADACVYCLRNICGDIKTFVAGRAKALYNATTNEKNAQKFIECIKIRLSKTSGTFVQCYGNLLGLDPQYKKIRCQAGLIDTSGLLVSKAKTDSSDPKAFINAENNPNYIDINVIDSTYFGNRRFKKSDTVYIIGDGCVEFKTTIKSVKTVYLNESDFENAEQKEDGSIDKVLTKTEYCTRLELSNKLPDYYCKNCNTANIRVMKLT